MSIRATHESTCSQLFQNYLGIAVEIILESLNFAIILALVFLRFVNLNLYGCHKLLLCINKQFVKYLLLLVQLWIRFNLTLANGIEQVSEQTKKVQKGNVREDQQNYPRNAVIQTHSLVDKRTTTALPRIESGEYDAISVEANRR